MAKGVVESEELASVVVASDVRQAVRRPWYVVLRQWLFCLLFLGLAELGMRLAYDYRPTLEKERFDNFPNAAMEDRFVDQIARDDAYRVVVIGDSVVVGPSLLDRDQTIPRYMEAALSRAMPGRKIHVWNMAMAGARATDEYCLLLKVLQAKPDLVVVEANYFITAMDIKEQPIWSEWVARNLPTMPPEIAPLLTPRKPQQVVEDSLTDLFEKHVRLLGMRQAVNARLFGVQPRVPFNSPNPAVMITVNTSKRAGYLRMEPWHRRGYAMDGFVSPYSRPFEADNMNGRFYRLLVSQLAASGVPSVTYATPQNPALTHGLLAGDRFDANRRAMAGYLAHPAVPYHDYSDLVPSELFYDNDHLLADGNRLVGEALARDVEPVVRRALDNRR